MSVTRSWLRSIRGVQSLLFDTRVREIKNEVSIRQIFSRTRHFCHMSISFGCLTGLTRYFVLGFDLFLWPDVGLFFLRRWILTRLFFLVFVDMNRHYVTESRGRSQSRYRDPWMGYSLLPKLIALDFKKKTREKMETLGRNDIFFRKPLSQTFSLMRLDFSESPRFPFFLLFRCHTSVN